METKVFEIEFNDGRVFRIFCANRTQKQKVIRSYIELKESGQVKEVRTLTNGIHTTAQWFQYLENESKS